MSEDFRLRLIGRRDLTSEICQFVFQGIEGRLPAFDAGSHLIVRTPAGPWRSYSLCNDAEDFGRYVIAVKREESGGGGSLSMHRELQVGHIVEARPPRSAFFIKPAAAYLFIAGGIGITPLLPMFRRLVRSGAAANMIYLTRSIELTPYADLLMRPPFSSRTILHHDGGDPQRIFDLWPVLKQPDERHLYYCGPGPLLTSIYRQTVHWPRAQIHSENFAASSRPDVTAKPFRLRRARTDEVFDIPADKSILDVLRARRIEFQSSCESGICGTCRMRWTGGAVDHRDTVLSRHERESELMPCVSRAVSDEITVDF